MSTDNKQRRVSLTLAQKYETIDYHDKNPNAMQKELTARFKISQSTLSKIIHDKGKTKIDYFGARINLDQKKRRSKFGQIEEPLFRYYNFLKNFTVFMQN